jgi:hypothetical protein
MPSVKPHNLDYAPRPPLVQRRKFRRIIWILCFLFLFAAAALYAPQTWHRIQLLYWQRQCMNYTAPHDQIVFDNDPTHTIKFQTLSPSAWKPPVPAMHSPPAWQRFCSLYFPSGLKSSGSAFLHLRQNSRGEKRLVAVNISLANIPHSMIEWNSHVIKPGSIWETPQESPLRTAGILCSSWVTVFGYHDNKDSSTLILPFHVTVFAGIPDSNDPSHFTFYYDTNNERKIIDGYLRDDDDVLLEERRPTTQPNQ